VCEAGQASQTSKACAPSGSPRHTRSTTSLPGIAVDNVISDYIPNPTFEVVARPGAFAEYFAGNNPEGKSLRELAGKPMRTGEEFRTAEPRPTLLDELGLDAALMFPTLASQLEVRLTDDPELMCTVIHAFNQWLYDEWTFNYRDRIFATPIVNPSIPERGGVGVGKPDCRHRCRQNCRQLTVRNIPSASS
jgi:hypothetical protein